MCAPALVLALGPLDGVRSANVLALLVNTAVLSRHRQSARYSEALRLLLPAALVAPIAAWIVRRSDADVLSVVAGLTIVGSVGVLAIGVRSDRLRGRGGAVVAGATSAAMNVVGGVGGPAVAMYAINAGWPASATRSTLQVYFIGLNVVSILVLGPPEVSSVLALCSIGGLGIGSVVGARLAPRVSASAVRRATLILAACGGVAAIGRGLL